MQPPDRVERVARERDVDAILPQSRVQLARIQLAGAGLDQYLERGVARLGGLADVRARPPAGRAPRAAAEVARPCGRVAGSAGPRARRRSRRRRPPPHRRRSCSIRSIMRRPSYFASTRTQRLSRPWRRSATLRRWGCGRCGRRPRRPRRQAVASAPMTSVTSCSAGPASAGRPAGLRAGRSPGQVARPVGPCHRDREDRARSMPAPRRPEGVRHPGPSTTAPAPKPGPRAGPSRRSPGQRPPCRYTHTGPAAPPTALRRRRARASRSPGPDPSRARSGSTSTPSSALPAAHSLARRPAGRIGGGQQDPRPQPRRALALTAAPPGEPADFLELLVVGCW